MIPFFPVFAGTTFFYYINKSSNRNDVARVRNEVAQKGFAFQLDCKKFIVANTQRAFQWAYQLGIYYKPQFGTIDDHFFKSIDPNSKCIKFFRENFRSQFAVIPKEDVYFYISLIKYYYLGLIDSRIVPVNILQIRYNDIVNTAVRAFGLNYNVLGKLEPPKMVNGGGIAIRSK